MIRWAYITLFIGLVLFKPVSQLSWEIWYEINFDYVANELCENKEEPELKCNGKCYLMKQLAKAEAEKPQNNEQEQSNPYLEKSRSFLFGTTSLVHPVILTEPNSSELFAYQAFQSQEIIMDFFHPPCKLS